MKNLILIYMSLLVTAQGRASVNMKNASFETKWKEHFLEKTYNSRSMYRGFLGIGWCTNLELQIEFDSLNNPNLYECNKKIFFKKYEYINGEYHFTLSNGNQYVFDKNKHFVRIIKTNGFIKLEIQYKNNIINTIKDDRQITWKAMWKDRFLSALKSRIDFIRFEQNQNNLLTASIKQNSIWLFAYDELDNLTSIKDNKGNYKKLKYDLDTDQIRSIEDNNGCTEKYGFSEHLVNNLYLQLSKVTQECKGLPLKDLIYEFYFLKNTDGSFTHVNTKQKWTGGLE